MKKTWNVKEFRPVYKIGEPNSECNVNAFLNQIGEDVISVTPFHTGDGFIKYVVIYFTVFD